MLEPHTFALRDPGDRRNLVEHEVFDLRRREAHLAPSESCQVLKTRVRPHADAARVCEADGPSEDARIPSVESRGDIRRSHRREEGLIVPDSVSAVGFADVGIEIDAHRADKLVTSRAPALE